MSIGKSKVGDVKEISLQPYPEYATILQNMDYFTDLHLEVYMEQYKQEFIEFVGWCLSMRLLKGLKLA